MFEKIWERVKERTDISTFRELAEKIGTRSQYVSDKKRQDDFPLKWAFQIAQEYDLSTDWIMTGKESKKNTENSYTEKLTEWISEEEKREDARRVGEIELQIERALPEFKEWLEAKYTKAKAA